MELIFLNFRCFRLQKIGTEHWAVCDASNYKNNFTKDVNNEILTLNPEPRKELYIDIRVFLQSVITVYTLRYAVPNLIIPFRFEVFPTTEISVIFHHISLPIETPIKAL
jgi:hypothetical protein